MGSNPLLVYVPKIASVTYLPPKEEIKYRNWIFISIASTDAFSELYIYSHAKSCIPSLLPGSSFRIIGRPSPPLDNPAILPA